MLLVYAFISPPKAYSEIPVCSVAIILALVLSPLRYKYIASRMWGASFSAQLLLTHSSAHSTAFTRSCSEFLIDSKRSIFSAAEATTLLRLCPPGVSVKLGLFADAAVSIA